jgi:hypothetical protein
MRTARIRIFPTPKLKQWLQKVELRLWKFLIPWMENSPWFKRLMPRAYHTVKAYLNKKTILVLGGCMAAGGSLGFLLGMLI